MSEERKQVVYTDEYGTVTISEDMSEAETVHDLLEALLDNPDTHAMAFAWDPDGERWLGYASWGDGENDGCIFEMDPATANRISSMFKGLHQGTIEATDDDALN